MDERKDIVERQRHQRTVVSHRDEPLTDEIREVSQQVGHLVREHIELAKVEMKQTVKATGRDAGLVAAGAGLALLGYVLLMFGIGYALQGVLGLGGAFLLIAALHLVIGGALAAVFGRKLRQPKTTLDQTGAELRRDRRFVSDLGEEMRHGPH